jgi:hypothetical protein
MATDRYRAREIVNLSQKRVQAPGAPSELNSLRYRASVGANQWLMSRTMLRLIRSVCIVELGRTWYSAFR